VCNELQDTTWTPLGAPNTNRKKPGITPAFPAYTSGHATFGTAVLEVVRLALKPARTPRTTCSSAFEHRQCRQRDIVTSWCIQAAVSWTTFFDSVVKTLDLRIH
jgi:hypothetical protein